MVLWGGGRRPHAPEEEGGLKGAHLRLLLADAAAGELLLLLLWLAERVSAASARAAHCFLRSLGSAAVPRSHSSLLEEVADGRTTVLDFLIHPWPLAKSTA